MHLVSELLVLRDRLFGLDAIKVTHFAEILFGSGEANKTRMEGRDELAEALGCVPRGIDRDEEHLEVIGLRPQVLPNLRKFGQRYRADRWAMGESERDDDDFSFVVRQRHLRAVRSLE